VFGLIKQSNSCFLVIDAFKKTTTAGWDFIVESFFIIDKSSYSAYWIVCIINLIV